MPKILVTDCWTRKTLSAVRSLGKEGIDVDAVSHTRIAPGIYSKYVNRYYIVPDPAKHPEKYLALVISLIQKNDYDCILPFEETSIEVFLGARANIERFTRLPLADRDSYRMAADKWTVLQLAARLDIPLPKTFRPDTDDEINDAVAQIGFPLIIKPVNSSGSRGLKKATREADFRKAYPEIRAKYGPPLIQECIPASGEGCGVGLLAKNGEVVADFSYRRLREFPLAGGPSTLRESTDDAETKRYAAMLMKSLNWNGVAMVEFKRDEHGIPRLMEINPRFWGSLDLANVSGINFPYLLFLQASGEVIEKPRYPKGIMSRWLFPGDIAHFLVNPNRFRLEPSFFNFFAKNIFYDDFKRDDIPGNVAVLLCTIAMAFSPEVWRIGVFRK